MNTMKSSCKRVIAMAIAILLIVSLPGFCEKNDGISDNTPIAQSDESAKFDEDVSVGYDEQLSAQREALNMLNHLTVMTTQINEAKRDRLFLKSAYDYLFNDIKPNVDIDTQSRIMSLVDTIYKFQMIDEKWERLEYIYEQNRAQAIRQAIPNPIGLLSIVNSTHILTDIAAVVYMTVDTNFKNKYGTSDAELSYLQSGWELKQAEKDELHNNSKSALSYIFNMSRKINVGNDKFQNVLREKTVKDFINHVDKPDSQLVEKIEWFEQPDHYNTYNTFGPYWLELTKDYYKDKQYDKCLNAIAQYEFITSQLSLKDSNYANVMPMAIVAAKETLNESEYCAKAEQYCEAIKKNTKDNDWSLRYYAAQTYLDLYSITNNTVYLDEAYALSKNNVVNLVDQQRALNDEYQKKYVDVKSEKDDSKRKKEEVKQYNKLTKERRKTALPPVSEALYLNCDLLFALAEQRGISDTEQDRINRILHVDGNNMFLTQALDNKFWFGAHEAINENDYVVSFTGKTLTIPASCVTDRSIIIVTVSGDDGTESIDHWEVTNVDRHKSENVTDFTVQYENKLAKGEKAHKFKAGEIVTIKVIPVAESEDDYLEFQFNVVATKKLKVLDDIKFERITR